MNTMTTSAQVKRSIVYVDEKIQKGLLVALVVLEVLLVAGTLWVLYRQMGEVLDANLYRVHFSQQPNIYPLLFKTGLMGIGALVAVNVIVLWVATWLWARHVDSIIRPFRELVAKVEALDFTEDQANDVLHEVVDLALAWRHSKRRILHKLRAEIAKLDELGDLSDPEAQRRARSILESIREQLPHW